MDLANLEKTVGTFMSKIHRLRETRKPLKRGFVFNIKTLGNANTELDAAFIILLKCMVILVQGQRKENSIYTHVKSALSLLTPPRIEIGLPFSWLVAILTVKPVSTVLELVQISKRPNRAFSNLSNALTNVRRIKPVMTSERTSRTATIRILDLIIP